MSDLKSCPFCGGPAGIRAEHYINGAHSWWLECSMCHIRTKEFHTVDYDGSGAEAFDKAVETWNRRVDEGN